MPTLKTKDYTREVGLDHMLCLVLPRLFSGTSLQKSKLVNDVYTYRIRYWNLELMKQRLSERFPSIEQANASRKIYEHKDDIVVELPVSKVLEEIRYYEKHYRIRPVFQYYPYRDVPIDPAMLGLWLGDGISLACKIATADDEILDYVTKIAQKEGLCVVQEGKYLYSFRHKKVEDRKRNSTKDVNVVLEGIKDLENGMKMKDVVDKYKTSPAFMRRCQRMHKDGSLLDYYKSLEQNPITKNLKKLGVFGNKHIPKLYLENSKEVRLQVLSGLIDTDGHLDNGGYEMCFANKRLLDDTVILARSLGFRCHDAKQVVKVCTNSAGGPKEFIAFYTRICGGNNLREIPLLVPRKRITEDKKQRFDQLKFTIEP